MFFLFSNALRFSHSRVPHDFHKEKQDIIDITTYHTTGTKLSRSEQRHRIRIIRVGRGHQGRSSEACYASDGTATGAGRSRSMRIEKKETQRLLSCVKLSILTVTLCKPLTSLCMLHSSTYLKRTCGFVYSIL